MNLHECMEDSQTAQTLDQTNKCPIAVYLAKQNYDSLQPRRKFGALSPFRKLGSARAELSRRYAFFEGSLTLTFLPSSFLLYWLTAAAGGGGGERCEPSAACPIRCHRRSVLPIAHGVLLLPARRPPSSARRPPTAWRGVFPLTRGALLAVRLAPHDAARRKGKKALRLTGYD